MSQEEKIYNKMFNAVKKDLIAYAKKHHAYNVPDKIEYLRRVPFYLQLRDAMHNIFIAGGCVHTLNDMIKDAKKEALKFETDKFKE